MIYTDENRSIADSSPRHLLATRPQLHTAPLGARSAPAGTEVRIARWGCHGLEQALFVGGCRGADARPRSSTGGGGTHSITLRCNAWPHSRSRGRGNFCRSPPCRWAQNYLGIVGWLQTPAVLPAMGLLWPWGSAGRSPPVSARAEAGAAFPHQLPMAQCGRKPGAGVGDGSPQVLSLHRCNRRGGPRAG